ncbi:MAG: metalloprotease PmbA [Pseudomonadota bacterium]
MSTLDLEASARLALDYARACGADQAEASLHSGTGVSITARHGELETIEKHNDGQIAISVYKDQKTGAASSADFSEAGIKGTIDAAMSIASFTGVDECLGLADADRMAADLKDMDQFYRWDQTIEELGDIALKCEAAALKVSDKISNSEGASVSTYQGASVYANSHGFLSHRHGSQHSVSCSVIGEDDQGMQRDYWYDSHRNPAHLADAAQIGEKAAERTVARLGSRKISSTEAPVLFDPSMAKSLIGHLINALKGGAIYKKASFMVDRIDQQVLPDFVTLAEHPHLMSGHNSSLHDAEGVATPAYREIISAGKLCDYVLGSYTARKLGVESTANAGGVRNLRISHSQQTFEQLLTTMGTGLYVTELIGSGINMVSGDYSRGAAGFWVENGEVQFPVEEITIAGNLLDMYANIVAIGSDTDTRGNTHCGSILLEKMTIAGS